MNKVMNTNQEVERELSSLKHIRLQIDTTSTEIIDRVWQKVETPYPYFAFPLIPSFISLAVVLAVISGIWIYPYFQVSHKGKTLKQLELPDHGILIDRKGGSAGDQVKTIIQAGDKIVTREDEEMTFFFPHAGYFHLNSGSNAVVARAEEDSNGQGYYRFFLDSGKLYARADHLANGSRLEVNTSFGIVHVVGTDFVTEVKKDEGMTLDVLKGVVQVTKKSESKNPVNVEKGFQTLLSSSSSGTILVNKISDERAIQLNEEFNKMFSGVAQSTSRDESAQPQKSNFRILFRKEE